MSNDLTEFGAAAAALVEEAEKLKEEFRLLKLGSLNVLDTPPEAIFDDLVLLAAQRFDVPTAMLTFIDDHRAYIKASRNGAPIGDNPKDISFCTTTVQNPHQINFVQDAANDPVLAGNPWVAQGFTRFYAGVPLVTDDGYAVGSLCVVSAKPRSLTCEEADYLWALSRVAMRLVMGR